MGKGRGFQMKPINEWTVSDILSYLKSVDKKTWIMIGVATFVTLLFGLLVFGPAWIARPKVIREIQLLKGRIVTVETLKRKKSEMLQNQEHYESLIKGVKERLFKPGETAFLLGMISKLAEESKVSIVASKPMEYDGKFPAPFNTRYAGSLFEFSLEGDYHSLGNFVSRIESHEKVLRIQSFSMTAFQSGNRGLIRANLTLSAVSLQQGAT
jgi:hypothetical protein